MKRFTLREFYILCFVSILILYGFICGSNGNYNPDLRYLFNRATQIYNCFSDGNLPWFYYNDFQGVGYGSSFFYGQLTLIPFCFLVPYGIDIFLNIYVFVTILITYFGIRCFASRYTDNAKYVSLLYISSTFAYYIFLGTGTYTNLFGIGLSFLFLSYCIDFFRDKKSFIKASLLFYIILNTHLISALISFLVCFLLFILYFDKDRIKNYIEFLLFTFILCIYNMLNILYHSDILNRMTEINNNIIKGFDLPNGKYVSSVLYLSKIPFGGLLFNLIFGNLVNEGYHYFNWVIFFVVLFCLIKYKDNISKKEKFLLVLSCILSIISVKSVWFFINKFINILIQFPSRIAPYIIVFIILFIVKHINSKRLLYILFITCLPDLLFGSLFTWKLDNVEYTDLECQIINGEYLDSSFVFDLNDFYENSKQVIDSKGNKYDYIIDKDKVIVSIDNKINDILQIPKLYYKGYVCYSKDLSKNFEVTKGYSQFINVDISNYEGIIIVQYRHPVWLKCMFFIDFAILIFSSVFIFVRYFLDNKKS